MIVDSIIIQVLIAATGGIAAELLHWYALSRKPQVIPKYMKKPLYWMTTLGMVAVGGLMPILYIEGSASALLCFHLGAATPVIIQKLMGNLPGLVAAQGQEDPSFREFFQW